MKFSFKMNADDYFYGLKYKIKKSGHNNSLKIIVVVFALILLMAVNIYWLKGNSNFNIYTILFTDIVSLLAILLMVVLGTNVRKKNDRKWFYASPVLTDTQTIRTYDEGIEFINSYEKIFVPWQSIFSVEDTAERLMIMASFRKGLFIINKSIYGGEELNALIDILRKRTTVKEG